MKASIRQKLEKAEHRFEELAGLLADPEILRNSQHFRDLSVEYARLQGFPDDHCAAVSVYDQYALLGNAAPPPLVRWALARMLGDGASIPTRDTQVSMAIHA